MGLEKGVHLKFAHIAGRGAICYTPDGRHIITCGEDTLVKVFDADELGAEPRTFENHEASVTALAIDRKGARFVTGTDAHIAQVFNFPSGEGQRILTRMQSAIRSVAFDPKGKLVAVGADDGAIRLTMVSAVGSQFVSIKGHTDTILCVAFDPKGEYLASSSADGTVRIWDIVLEPKLVKTIHVCGRVAPGSAQVLGFSWHPNGDSLAIPKGSTVAIHERGTWEASSEFRGGHIRDVCVCAYSPNGRYLASAGLDKQVFVWDVNDTDSLDRHKGDATPCGLTWSPIGNSLAFLDDSGQLAMWAMPIPSHYPSPFGDADAVADPPIPATSAAAPGAKVSTVSASSAAATTASAAAASTASAASGTAAAPASINDSADGDAGAQDADAGNYRRRLRKVVHDSDDGGFSDHDDDEAVEAALLAEQLRMHGANRAGATGSLAQGATGRSDGAGAGVAGLSKAAAALLAGAPLIRANAQPVLHSSSTPAKNSRRFLLWNLTGMVLSRDENTYSAIEVEFNDASLHRTMRLTDHYGFSMAALDEAAVVFASKANNGNPSTLVYRPLASWAPHSDWQVQFEKGEEALAVAVGHKFAAVATTARYLRIYSHTGATRTLLCYSGPLVALAASRGLLAIVTHAGSSAVDDDQAMTVTLYDLREPSRPVRLASEPLPLSPAATLDWVGFSDAGALSTVDSLGVVRQCLRSAGFAWAPILHCASLKKSKSEHHWIVGLTTTQLMCVLCKGEDRYPATLPRPVLQALPLGMPLACSDAIDPSIDAQRLAASIELDEYRLATEEAGVGEEMAREHMVREYARALAEDVETQPMCATLLNEMRLITKIDSLSLKLFQAANKAERNARALDLAMQLQLPKSIHGALKLANHFKLGQLAERITKLLEAKHDDAELDDDIEAAPQRAVAPTQRPRPVAVANNATASRPAAPQQLADEATTADADADDEDGAPEDPPAPTRPRSGPPPVLNPFAKSNTAAGGKSVLELGSTGTPTTGKATKRKAIVTEGAAAKKAR